MDSVHENTCISIVIVNSGGNQDTLNCLASIKAYPPDESYEIILVDNCSNPPFILQLQEKYPRVKILSVPQRQGFARNYNMGLRQARGDFWMILNNDTLVHPDTFTTLLQALRSHPEYGMVGPKLLSVDGYIQPPCNRRLITPWFYLGQQFLFEPSLPWGRLWQRFQGWQINNRGSGPVACLSGACMLVRREVLERVGLMDENYEFYYEDIEWCHRMQRYGLKVAYVSESRVTHLGDRSLSKEKVWAKQSEYKSALRYFRQYHSLSSIGAWLLWMTTVISYGLRALAYTLIEWFSHHESHARAYRELWRWIQKQSQEVSDKG